MADRPIHSFRDVVAERVVQMNVIWIQLEQGVGHRDIGDGLLRELHTLKGEASLLGFEAISSLAHALEDIVSAVVASDEPPAPETGDRVLQAFDLITSLSEQEPGPLPPNLAEFLSSLHAIAEQVAEESDADGVPGDSGASTESADPAPVGPTLGPGLATTSPGLHFVDPAPETRPGAPQFAFPPQETAPPFATDELSRGGSSYSVKVSPKQLDRMRDIIGELLLLRTRLGRFATALHEQRYQDGPDRGRPIAPSPDAMPSAPDPLAVTADHDDVLRSIEGQLRDDVLRMSNLVNALDDVTRDLRMVSVSVLFERFPLAVRTIGRELGRQVQLSYRGEAVQADRDVLSALDDPLIHLVRNAIDHGIEPPEVRRARGKPEVGTLSLEASVVGDMLRVRISDDGAGIDVENVRNLAIERGLVDPGMAQAMSRRDVLQCLFAPGMSTRKAVTSVSGRGIGLDVVQKTARNLGGSVELQSQLGASTTFLINVPIRASITSVQLFRVGRGWYALPTSSLVAIEELDDYAIAIGSSGPALRYKDGSLVSLVALEPLLGEPRFDSKHGRRRTRVMMARHGTSIIGLTGSYDHRQQDAVLKSASTMFSDSSLITAGLALEDGSVALVLNQRALFHALESRSNGTLGLSRSTSSPLGSIGDGDTDDGRGAHDADDARTTDDADDADTPPRRKHTVLVAEDSPIVRQLVVDALRVQGLEVVEAVDGQDALEKLDVHPEVELLVTDVEMPRRSGLQLIAALRARGGKRIPAIVVSTRGSDEDKAAAVEVGADAYLVKSDFSSEGLWSLVSRFLG